MALKARELYRKHPPYTAVRESDIGDHTGCGESREHRIMHWFSSNDDVEALNHDFFSPESVPEISIEGHKNTFRMM